MSKTNGRILYFELLRGLTILMIIIVHSYQMYTLPSYARVVQRFGMMGCQIFFFISGFFSLRLFSNKSDIWNIYKKKLLRIVPAYWLAIFLGAIVVVLCTIVEGVNNTGIVLSSKTVIPNILLVNGIIPGDTNNNVVRGGWFVGTLIILYYLTPIISESKLCRIFRKVGELDYYIMLTHVFIVFDLNRVIVRFIDINHLLLYILLFPLELVLIYYVTKLYRRVVERPTALLILSQSHKS